jgi:hypothetical protein
VSIILNLSAPKGLSVDEAIDKDLILASMSSTEAWLDVLNLVGVNCSIMKIDFADAYSMYRWQALTLICSGLNVEASISRSCALYSVLAPVPAF